MSKKKRNKPKRWYEENITNLIKSYNMLYGRLYSLEAAFGMYVDMRKNKAKLEKFIKNKLKDDESKKDKESNSQAVRDA